MLQLNLNDGFFKHDKGNIMSDVFNPLVSIIIPVYNGSNYVKEAIDSALAQTYKNIEIIVVNDGSTDNTEKIVKSYGDKIRYFYKENGGVASALNLAIENAKGEYISWLSHDDVYYPNKIQKQIELLKDLEDKNTILYSNFQTINARGKELKTTCFHKLHFVKKLNYSLYPILNGLIHGCSLLLPKQIFNKYGYFDAELKCTQDYDFWYKTFPDFNIVYMPDVLIKSRVHKNQDSKKHINNTNECDKLWIKMISELNEQQIRQMSGSLLEFYKKEYEICYDAGYFGAADYIDGIIRKTANSSNTSDYKVSVIIPFFNRIKYTIDAIESVLAQTHKNIEIILINDASTEDIGLILDYVNRFSFIKLYCNDENMGAHYSRNIGVKNSTGDYIAFLDSDDFWEERKLEVQLSYMLKNNWNATYMSYKRVNNDGEIFEEQKIKLKSFGLPRIILSCSIATPTVMLKKEVFKNSIDIPFSIKYGEDICLWIKIAENYTFYGIDECLVNVRVNSNSTINDWHKFSTGILNIAQFVLQQDYSEFYQEEIYNLVKALWIKRETTKRDLIVKKIYRITLRPILKLIYGKKIVKQRFDKAFSGNY